ncbi:phosphoserine phosphatase SerB [Methylobacillus flagellatus]|uniref:phosphoserine phosphatase SerB n=1 Tax=Methylobacillus flagellatus TaxID=405 RepID=UPI0028539092|nr:phosphoserine phosphatase SerB [Methylobacillus flagellatus]MDR5172732.1 phosphoserine phosphatase SerB [Methylobacillus flagellatus]
MRLVIQGPVIRFEQLAHIHQLLSASHQQFIQIGEHAYQLAGQAEIPPALHAFCLEQRIDVALVEDKHQLNNLGLAVMDMDSTLITIECIDEIADMQGLKPQVAAITESAMRGEIEFAESLRRRVALLKGLDASALQRVIDERLQLTPGAQAWIAACKQHGIKTMLVSGGFDFFADRVKAMLDLDVAKANSLEIVDGKLTGRLLGHIVDAQAKADYLERFRQELGLRHDQVAAIGDGANDLKMMSAAGCGVAYHAKPVVQQQATYALNHVDLEGLVYLFAPLSVSSAPTCH